jgi:hypothetical protein
MKKFIDDIRKEEPKTKLLKFEDIVKNEEIEREFDEEFGEDPYQTMTGMSFPEMAEETNLSFAMHMGIMLTMTQLMSVILEHETMRDFAALINKTYKKYCEQKSVSPSFISCWALYDARIKESEGTFADLLIALKDDFSLEAEIVQLIKLTSPSYPMVYQYLGSENSVVRLRDVMTDQLYDVYHENYKGNIGEIWYTRLLPPLNDQDPYVMLSFPYVTRNHEEADWLNYFKLQGITKTDKYVKIKLENHMKYGPTIHFWKDYVSESFEAEIPHQCILLNSLPKVKKK